jgi:DNA-binding CsgD family transcriptional regulator
MFTDFGMAAFAERTRIELLATGEHVRSRTVETLGQLTPQEEQISRLVAQGNTNREIAAQLFLSPRTVEYHLHKAFRKLGVRSRTSWQAGWPSVKGANIDVAASSRGSVVLVNEPAEAVTTVNRAAGWRPAGTRHLWRAQVERAVRPFAVVVLDVGAHDALEVASVQDQQPVEAFGADSADEALRNRVRTRCRTGVLTIRMPSLRKTSSNGPLYLLSRSRMRKRAA